MSMGKGNSRSSRKAMNRQKKKKKTLVQVVNPLLADLKTSDVLRQLGQIGYKLKGTKLINPKGIQIELSSDPKKAIGPLNAALARARKRMIK